MSRMDRRGFVRTAGGILIAGAGLGGCGEYGRLDGGFGPSLSLSPADDALTGTAQLVEKPAGSGQWRLASE